MSKRLADRLYRRIVAGFSGVFLTRALVIFTMCSTSIAFAATSFVWTGGSSIYWSDQNNWSPVGVPSSGDSLEFPFGASNKTNTNNLPAQTSFVDILFSGDGYAVDGNEIVVTHSLASASGASMLNLSVNVLSNVVSVGELVFNAPIRGTGTINFTKDIVVSGSHFFSGTIHGNGRRILLNGAQLPSASISGGGIIDGLGAIGAVSAAESGWLQVIPAGAGTTGVLYTGSLSLSTFAFFNVDINGSTEGAGYDQMNVTGTVALGEKTSLVINLSDQYSPVVGQEFVLIKNDGSDAVTGAFIGMPEGATVVLKGRQFRVTYYGGDGNDVSLVAVTGRPPTTTSLLSSLNPADIRQEIVFTASVSSPGGTVPGSVVFSDGGSVLATVPLTSGTATYTTSTLSIGTHAISVSYTGNASFGSSAVTLDELVRDTGLTEPPLINAPTIVSITPGKSRAQITVTPPITNGGSPVASYTATCIAADQQKRTGTSVGTTITVARLTAGITYSCTVTANSAVANSQASLASSAQTVVPLPGHVDITPILMLLLLD